MMQLLVFSLLSVGVTGQQLLTYYDVGKEWSEAQTYCRQYHTDLVTIRTTAENNQITGDSWLGLYRDNASANWKWSRGDEPLTFANIWNGDDPDDDKHCVYKQDPEEWRSKDCTETRKFYCVDEILFFMREMKTWEEALEHCRSLGVIDPTLYSNHSYDLALITQEDHEDALEKMQTAETDRVWIGLRFLGDQWTWVSGEEAQYDNITSCPTVNRCGALKTNSSNFYSIGKCQERKNFLCYKKLPAV